FDGGPNAEVPLCDRSHVYAFLVNGLTPPGPSGLDGLRMKLAEHGFAKVYCGELCHVWWMWQEMKRIGCDDPAARFVLAGYDFGCGSAAGLARDAARRGLNVDALVLLDPATSTRATDCAIRTVVIRSRL